MVIFFSRVDFIFFFYFVLSLSSVCVLCVCVYHTRLYSAESRICVCVRRVSLAFSRAEQFLIIYSIVWKETNSAWPRFSKCTSCFIVLLFGRNFGSAALLLKSSPVDTIPAGPIANTNFAQCESNNNLNNTHLLSQFSHSSRFFRTTFGNQVQVIRN